MVHNHYDLIYTQGDPKLLLETTEETFERLVEVDRESDDEDDQFTATKSVRQITDQTPAAQDTNQKVQDKAANEKETYKNQKSNFESKASSSRKTIPKNEFMQKFQNEVQIF